MEKNTWLRRLIRWIGNLFRPPDGPPPSSRPDSLQAGPRLRLLAAADLEEDRHMLRRFSGVLGWLTVFAQEWEGVLPVPACDALIVIPATAERAAALAAAGAGGLPAAGRSLPVFFVAPADIASADLARARLVFAAVEVKPLLLSSYRRRLLAIVGRMS